MKVGIINYGVGNLGSIGYALCQQRAEPIIIDRPVDLIYADCLILPGVGNFSDCAARLDQGGWTSAVRDIALQGLCPLLGICVGMQLLADMGTEGIDGSGSRGTQGLGLIPGTVQHLSTLGCSMHVPHVGWNEVRFKNKYVDSIFHGMPERTDFYFAHSYAFVASDDRDIIAVTDHGIPVTAAIRRGNVWGTQFHPEKSSLAGYRLLQNFITSSLC